MKIKKVVLSFVTLVGLIALAGCSSNSALNKNVVTMKGNTIEVIDIYNEAKLFPNLPTTSLIQNLTFSKLFEKEFGKKVTDKDVTNEFNKEKAQYGKQFTAYLNAQGMSEDTFRAQIRLNLLQEAAIDHETIEHQMSQADLKAAWAKYNPAVTAYISVSTTKADADKAHDEAVNKASDFKKEAETKKLKQTFDSSSTTIPQQVMEAAFKLKDGQTSSVISVSNSQTGAPSYYLVDMIKNPGKGKGMKAYKAQLENYIKTTKRSDSAYVQGVIKDYLTENNVTVKDQAFSKTFSQYLGNN